LTRTACAGSGCCSSRSPTKGEPIAAYLPASIKGFAPYLPSNAGGTIWGAGKLFGGHQLSPWTGFAVLCGYAVVLTAAAAWRLRRRDA
jgi:hypothetical protein